MEEAILTSILAEVLYYNNYIILQPDNQIGTKQDLRNHHSGTNMYMPEGMDNSIYRYGIFWRPKSN